MRTCWRAEPAPRCGSCDHECAPSGVTPTRSASPATAPSSLRIISRLVWRDGVAHTPAWFALRSFIECAGVARARRFKPRPGIAGLHADARPGDAPRDLRARGLALDCPGRRRAGFLGVNVRLLLVCSRKHFAAMPKSKDFVIPSKSSPPPLTARPDRMRDRARSCRRADGAVRGPNFVGIWRAKGWGIGAGAGGCSSRYVPGPAGTGPGVCILLDHGNAGPRP